MTGAAEKRANDSTAAAARQDQPPIAFETQRLSAAGASTCDTAQLGGYAPVKPLDEVPPPALRLVRRPAESREQPVADPRVRRVAQQGVGPLQLGERVEGCQAPLESWRSDVPRRRHDVFQREEVRKPPRLVVVQQAAIGLTARVVRGARLARSRATTAASATAASARPTKRPPAVSMTPYRRRTSRSRPARPMSSMVANTMNPSTPSTYRPNTRFFDVPPQQPAWPTAGRRPPASIGRNKPRLAEDRLQSASRRSRRSPTARSGRERRQCTGTARRRSRRCAAARAARCRRTSPANGARKKTTTPACQPRKAPDHHHERHVAEAQRLAPRAPPKPRCARPTPSRRRRSCRPAPSAAPPRPRRRETKRRRSPPRPPGAIHTSGGRVSSRATRAAIRRTPNHRPRRPRHQSRRDAQNTTGRSTPDPQRGSTSRGASASAAGHSFGAASVVGSTYKWPAAGVNRWPPTAAPRPPAAPSDEPPHAATAPSA